MMMSKSPPNPEEVECGEGLEGRRVLVLNQGYLPTNLVGWKQAITSVFLDRAELIKATSNRVGSVDKSYPLPSAMRLRERRFPQDWSDFLCFKKLGAKAGALA